MSYRMHRNPSSGIPEDQCRIIRPQAIDACDKKSIVHILYDRSRCPRVGANSNGETRFLPRLNTHAIAAMKSPASVATKMDGADITTNGVADPKASVSFDTEALHKASTNNNNSLSDSQVQASSSRRRRSKRNATPPPKSLAISTNSSLTSQIRQYGELYSITRFNSQYLPLTDTVSTISVAFSQDGHTLASTHGDHTVKITCCYSGKVLQVLQGHPRTPWTVKFHPKKSYIVASGCLGYQVRIWDVGTKELSNLYSSVTELPSGATCKNSSMDSRRARFATSESARVESATCLHMIRLNYAIISLSFHPSGDVLAMASGNSLHLWDYDNLGAKNSQQGDGNGNSSAPYNNKSEHRHDHALRCVHFPPDGRSVIVGGVNPPIDDEVTSFSLRLCDFDLDKALREGGITQGLSNSRKFVPRALLYNDGGFDVSPCGTYLCACAEYWLPYGMSTVTDLIASENAAAGITNEDDQGSEVSQSDDSEDEEDDEELLDAVEGGSQDGDSGNTPQRPGACRASIDTSSPPPNHLTGGRSGNLMSTPLTPPPIPSRMNLSPPSPPGRRLVTNNCMGNVGPPLPIRRSGTSFRVGASASFMSQHAGANRNRTSLQDHQSSTSEQQIPMGGRYVPHVITVNLDANHGKKELGKILYASPLEASTASGVTCVKFSPSGSCIILGYGVRETAAVGEPHQVAALYRIGNNQMEHVTTLLSHNDDVNIARFHPESGHGFVYGTKQGKVRVLSPKPWVWGAKATHFA